MQNRKAVSEQDLIDNANLLQSNARGTSGLSYRFEAAANSEIIAPEEYRKLIRGNDYVPSQLV